MRQAARHYIMVLTALVAMFGLLCASSCLAADSPTIMAPFTLTHKGNEEARSVIRAKGKLTLEVYLHAVDDNFPGLASAIDQQRIASANRLQKQGVFDPLLSNESGYTRMQNTSHIGRSKDVLFNYPKIELPFRSGMRVFTQYRYNPDSAESPYIETGKGGELSGGIFVPLLRGLIYNEQSVAEREAKYGEQLAAQTFFLTRLDTLLKAGNNYWNWVGAKLKADVSSEILKLSGIVIDIARQQELRGDLARIYVTEAEEDLERRSADLLQAQRDFQRTSFRLSAQLFDMGGIPLPLPSEANVPDVIPSPHALSDLESERYVLVAFTRRPELKAIDVQRNIATLQLKYAKNQLLPALNAVFVEGYDAGRNSIGNTYRGQVTFSEPLYLRTARGKVAEAKLRLDKLAQDRKAEEQRIRNEVLDAISAINLSFQKYEALARQVDKATQVYSGERERFNAGDSTVFLVVERERQLNEAKLRMIDSQVEYHNGLLALRAITADL